MRFNLRKHLAWIVPVVVADIMLFHWLIERGRRSEEIPPEAIPAPAASAMIMPSPWRNLALPTPRTNLLDPAAIDVVFQPTASGNPMSGGYGSVRTANNGSGLMSHFHEGIDIAAVARDGRGRPLDEVYAVADGKVGYINRVAGNSNYGKYVVLLHADRVGAVYTLYAHLASVADGLQAGQEVRAGQTIGVMGNTSSSPIPMERAHLHFEIGLINNMHFAQWYRANKLKPDHGNFHGRNFLGENPYVVLGQIQANPDFDFASHLALTPMAFELAIAAPHKPDFFTRYPLLWDGPAYDGGPIVVDCSPNGLPLKGRLATDAEKAALGTSRAAVLSVDETVLGRNGAHLVAQGGNGWKLAQNGQTWLDVFTY